MRNREGPPRFGPPALLPWAGGAGEAGAGGHRAAPAGLRPQRAARRVGALSPAPGPTPGPRVGLVARPRGAADG